MREMGNSLGERITLKAMFSAYNVFQSAVASARRFESAMEETSQ